ncbi:ISL3 family transposase [Syntrophus aciditrophicus]|uniref:Transposase n=2 Tax=Syntrophus aciditrophicus (strain SB) TaxID=56780 RepID=Q2LSI0_SYNAS|nr:ISL3 family transposase [Syntrophus aciditrophicus]ABC77042.1 transposase [Syntrophus aciditrophicus SB]ABC77772.1 transposase [Syntrophus aciditrophicus SB]
MSTSVLYHAFNLKGITYRATRFTGDVIEYFADVKEEYIRCPKCGQRKFIFKGQKTRSFHLGPMGRKRCFLVLSLHRIKCNTCDTLWWPDLPFMVGKHRFARSFALIVLDLLRFGTIRWVADYLGVGWDMIKEIHKLKLQRLYRNIPLHKVRYIGIDEFSIRKGHEYMTTVMDLSEGRILYATEGKGKEGILPFLKKLARKGKKLRAVAMDMGISFFSAVREALPNIDVVFDRYHIMALMNQGIENLRRNHQKELDDIGKQTLKGNRFLLLRNYDSLKPDHKERLDALMQANQPLFVMHSMKEQLRLFWEIPEYAQAVTFLDTWCKDAMLSGIKELVKVAKTLSGYRTAILNYFKHHITNAALEGTNNKIKTLKRQAYGFRDMEYFKLRLYHLHTQRYSLTG